MAGEDPGLPDIQRVIIIPEFGLVGNLILNGISPQEFIDTLHDFRSEALATEILRSSIESRNADALIRKLGLQQGGMDRPGAQPPNVPPPDPNPAGETDESRLRRIQAIRDRISDKTGPALLELAKSQIDAIRASATDQSPTTELQQTAERYKVEITTWIEAQRANQAKPTYTDANRLDFITSILTELKEVKTTEELDALREEVNTAMNTAQDQTQSSPLFRQARLALTGIDAKKTALEQAKAQEAATAAVAAAAATSSAEKTRDSEIIATVTRTVDSAKEAGITVERLDSILATLEQLAGQVKDPLQQIVVRTQIGVVREILMKERIRLQAEANVRQMELAETRARTTFNRNALRVVGILGAAMVVGGAYGWYHAPSIIRSIAGRLVHSNVLMDVQTYCLAANPATANAAASAYAGQLSALGTGDPWLDSLQTAIDFLVNNKPTDIATLNSLCINAIKKFNADEREFVDHLATIALGCMGVGGSGVGLWMFENPSSEATGGKIVEFVFNIGGLFRDLIAKTNLIRSSQAVAEAKRQARIFQETQRLLLEERTRAEGAMGRVIGNVATAAASAGQSALTLGADPMTATAVGLLAGVAGGVSGIGDETTRARRAKASGEMVLGAIMLDTPEEQVENMREGIAAANAGATPMVTVLANAAKQLEPVAKGMMQRGAVNGATTDLGAVDTFAKGVNSSLASVPESRRAAIQTAIEDMRKAVTEAQALAGNETEEGMRNYTNAVRKAVGLKVGVEGMIADAKPPPPPSRPRGSPPPTGDAAAQVAALSLPAVLEIPESRFDQFLWMFNPLRMFLPVPDDDDDVNLFSSQEGGGNSDGIDETEQMILNLLLIRGEDPRVIYFTKQRLIALKRKTMRPGPKLGAPLALSPSSSAPAPEAPAGGKKRRTYRKKAFGRRSTRAQR